MDNLKPLSDCLDARQPGTAARALLKKTFGGDLHFLNGRGWVYWNGERWVEPSRQELKLDVWRALLASNYMWAGRNGTEERRTEPTRNFVSDVMTSLEAFSEMHVPETPTWLNGEEMDRRYCIGFENRVLCVKGGELEEMERGRDWFDLSVLPYEWKGRYEPGQAPEWEKCLDQWSGHDPQWVELLQRWMGYCLVPHKMHARWMLLYGPPRSGKGTIGKVLSRLLGLQSYFGVALHTLAGDFGLQGLAKARVLCVSEVSGLMGREGERAVQVLKSVLGEDYIDINVKGLPIMRNVRLQAAPMMMSNEIPELPDKGRGLSSKMISLRFKRSWVDKEDVELDRKLSREMEAIAAWAVEGALMTERCVKWPMTEGAKRVVQAYEKRADPVPHFLAEHFEQDDEGVVTGKRVWELWQDNGYGRLREQELKSKMVGLWGLRGVRVQEGGKKLRALKGLRELIPPAGGGFVLSDQEELDGLKEFSK